MRTFHIGGTASRVTEQTSLEAKNGGTIKFLNLQTVRNQEGSLVAMNRNGVIAILDDKGREKERYTVVYGAKLRCEEGAHVKQGATLVEWDPYTFAILTENTGTIQFKDLLEGVTMHEELDEVTGLSRWVVVADSPDEKRQPSIQIRDDKHKVLKKYLIPSRAHLMVADGDPVHQGDVLAKIPRETTKTKDITGGLPRVVELFEARKPRETAVITEIDGIVKYGDIAKGQRKIMVVNENGVEREYSLPRGVHVNVQEGEHVKAGEPLMDGPRNPHDILAVLGEKELQAYLVNEIQEVYRLQGVNINDKHIEVIVRQMMRWIKIEDVGDTEFLIDEQVDKFRFQEENERVKKNGKPASGRPLLLGITKASLSTESFISAASFQETTRVLTEASISGKIDYLRGLKENVIMGRLIPAGTGLEYYRNVALMPDERELAAAAEEAAVERDSDDDLSGEDIREERMTT
jgi:DNA-directed RNA polymerase subunit beta'